MKHYRNSFIFLFLTITVWFKGNKVLTKFSSYNLVLTMSITYLAVQPIKPIKYYIEAEKITSYSGINSTRGKRKFK